MKKKVLLFFFVTIVLVFIPFNSAFVPEWKVQVIDENGNPYKGQLVRQFCDNYTLGVSPCSDASDSLKLTDENGNVDFPERNINMGLFLRLVRPLLNLTMVFPHGSYGADIYLDSAGPQGLETLKYVPGQPLPTKFILPSESFKIPD